MPPRCTPTRTDIACKSCGAAGDVPARNRVCRRCQAEKQRLRRARDGAAINHRKRRDYHANVEIARAYSREKYQRNKESERARKRAQRPKRSQAIAALGPAKLKQRRCIAQVREALAKGVLVRQPCERCGERSVNAHHDDYDRPLDVRWLCVPHHREWHRLNGPARFGDLSEVPMYNIRHNKPERAA